MAQDIDPLGVRLFVLLITSLVLIWTSILLRALAKSLVSKRVSLDDWLMFLSVVCNLYRFPLPRTGRVLTP